LSHYPDVMLWCHATVGDVGDRLMPEQSVLCRSDDLQVSGSLCPRSMQTSCLETSVFGALSLSSPPH